jgi:hypothetical protein
MTDFPNNYKFTSVEVWLNYDLNLYNRECYNLLDFFGDLGGLFDTLFLIGIGLTTFSIKVKKDSMLLESLFHYKANGSPDLEAKIRREKNKWRRGEFLYEHMVKNFNSRQSFKRPKRLEYIKSCLRRQKHPFKRNMRIA